MKNEIEYIRVSTDMEYSQAKEIFIEYQQFLNVDLCFQSFESELSNLNIIYQEPKGIIILAKYDKQIVGSIALKPIEVNNCEIKRLYIKPAFRGKGIGKELLNLIMEFAVGSNYAKIKLDTLANLTEAISLYRNSGFIETNAYVYNPLESVIYFEKSI